MNEFHEIIGNTTTTPNPQSDWNQKNDERPDYIKNKPILGDLAGKSKVSLSDLDESIQQTLSNAIVVNEDGRASVGADPVYDMDVATKRYVDSHVGTGGESDLKTVNNQLPDESGDILLYGAKSYEPRLTKVGSDFTRYLYLGVDKKRWMTAPEDVTLRATFQGGATIDYKTSGYELEVDYNGTNYAINFNGVTVWEGADASSTPVIGKVGLMHNGDSSLCGYTGAFVAEQFNFTLYGSTYSANMATTSEFGLVSLNSESSIDVLDRGLRYYRKPGTGRSLLLHSSPRVTDGKVKVKMAGPAYEAGIVFRYDNEKNYSYAFVNWDGTLVHIYQVIDGVEHAIASSIQIGNHQAHSDLTVVDASLDLEELHADAYTVTGDRKVYLVFNQKVKFDRFTLALAPAGILTEAGVAINDYIVSFDNSLYNLADILKNGYNGVAQTAIVWDNTVLGYHGETLSTDEVATVWGAEHRTYQFAYAGEVASVNSLPKLLTRCENVMLSVSDDMYLCMSNDYLVQTVLRNYKVATQPTCIIATESIASAVQSVTILCGDKTIATLSQADLKAMFLGAQGTPSFDWLTSPYETSLTIDGAVVNDLDFNGFDKEKNIISAYSAQACFISGVNGITGNSLANEYSIVLNPQIMSVNNVEIGLETWQKVPGGAINVDLEVRGDSFKPVANKAVRDYVSDVANSAIAGVMQYIDDAIPLATSDVAGKVKIGDGLDIAEDGTLSVSGQGESGSDTVVLTWNGSTTSPAITFPEGLTTDSFVEALNNKNVKFVSPTHNITYFYYMPSGALYDIKFSYDSSGTTITTVRFMVNGAASELEAESISVSQRSYNAINKYTNTSATPKTTLLPNQFYCFTASAVTSLTITLGTSTNYGTSHVQEYRFRFTSGSTPTTLSLPASVIGDIDILANHVYEVSIVDNYLTYQSWEVTS